MLTHMIMLSILSTQNEAHIRNTSQFEIELSIQLKHNERRIKKKREVERAAKEERFRQKGWARRRQKEAERKRDEIMHDLAEEMIAQEERGRKEREAQEELRRKAAEEKAARKAAGGRGRGRPPLHALGPYERQLAELQQ